MNVNRVFSDLFTKVLSIAVTGVADSVYTWDFHREIVFPFSLLIILQEEYSICIWKIQKLKLAT